MLTCLPQDVVPLHRYGHVSAVVGSRMYMYGGARSEGSEYYSDMFILHCKLVLQFDLHGRLMHSCFAFFQSGRR